MTDLIVRNLDSEVTERLDRRARDHGRSAEDEARAILAEAVKSPAGSLKLNIGSSLEEMFAGTGLHDDELDLFELPRQTVRPAIFD